MGRECNSLYCTRAPRTYLSASSGPQNREPVLLILDGLKEAVKEEHGALYRARSSSTAAFRRVDLLNSCKIMQEVEAQEGFLEILVPAVRYDHQQQCAGTEPW